MRIHVYTLRLKQRGGGSHQNLIVFSRALMRAGYDVVVHTLFSEGNDTPPDIALRRERGDGRSFLDLQRFCASLIARDQSAADVILIYGQALLWAGGIYKIQGGRVPTAVYLDSHLDSMKESHRGRNIVYRIKHALWERTIGRLYAGSVDRFIAASPYLVERFAAAGFPKSRFVVIPNAFDFTDRAQTRKANHDGQTILYVGRLSHEKGVDALLHALSRLQGDAKWRAVLAGDGPQREELKSTIRAANLKERIRITGWQDRAALAHEYASADMLVIPSRVPEPFGRSVVEAMHAGLPVVVPAQGGAAWVAGEAGTVFDNGDAASLSSAIKQLIDDSALRTRLGEAGKRRARDFDARIVGPALARELSNLINPATS